MMLCFLCSLGAGLCLFSVLHACRLSFCFVSEWSHEAWCSSSGGRPSSEGGGFSRGGGRPASQHNLWISDNKGEKKQAYLYSQWDQVFFAAFVDRSCDLVIWYEGIRLYRFWCKVCLLFWRLWILNVNNKQWRCCGFRVVWNVVLYFHCLKICEAKRV